MTDDEALDLIRLIFEHVMLGDEAWSLFHDLEIGAALDREPTPEAQADAIGRLFGRLLGVCSVLAIRNAMRLKVPAAESNEAVNSYVREAIELHRQAIAQGG